ncbi:MAG: hypothetical protein ACI4EL_07930 [Candidatus Fimimorpha sp.]
MRKSFKKVLCVLSASMCILGTAIPASADTVSFNVTTPGDPYSYAVRKADYEQHFYVTGTSFSRTGVSLRCRSGKAGQGVSSKSAYVSSGSRSSSASYTSYAQPNITYEMYATSSINGFNVTGRYTP